MIATVDTNILVYTVDDRDALKQTAAQRIVEVLKASGGVVGLQVCGEFYRASTRRLHRPNWLAAQAARNVMTSFPTFAATYQSTAWALGEAAASNFSFWDANLLAAAELAGCSYIFSEDMQDGARLGRIQVIRPFGPDGISEHARSVLSL